MYQENINLAGASCFWTLSEDTDFTKLDQALRRAGFGKFTPERPTSFAALRDVLYKQYGADYVYPVKNQPLPTFEVVTVKPDHYSDRNNYNHKLTARVTAHGDIATDTGDAATDQILTDAYRAKRNAISYNAVSRCLVDIVYSLNGTTLRPSGGIYFVPNSSFERWEMAAQAVEEAGPKNKTFALRLIMDEQAASAIREALTAEIQREAELIDKAFNDPEKGLRSASSQLAKARQLRRKIETYENTFEMMLPDLKRQLDQATGREAIATLMEVAADGPMLVEANS